MKALMSDRIKEIFRGCGGTHGKGIVRAHQEASVAHKTEFEFHCTTCDATFKFTIIPGATLK